jgi:hypothetical protein
MVAYLGDEKIFNDLASLKHPPTADSIPPLKQPVAMGRFFGTIPPRPASTPIVPPLAAVASGYNPAVMTWDCASHGSSGQQTSGAGSLAYSTGTSNQSGTTTEAPQRLAPSLQRAYSLEGMSSQSQSAQAAYSSIPVMCKMPSAGKGFADLAETLQVRRIQLTELNGAELG